jgi:uncharacterized glyoxalase superfamily protein PhnB
VTGILETLQFNAMVVSDGVEVAVKFDAASWADAVDLLHDQYGHDSQWALKADDAAARTG